MKLPKIFKKKDSNIVKDGRFKIKYKKPDFNLIVDYQTKRGLIDKIGMKLVKKDFEKIKIKSFNLPESTYPTMLKQSQDLLNIIEKEVKKTYPFFEFYKTDLVRAGIQEVDEEWLAVQLHFKGWINV